MLENNREHSGQAVGSSCLLWKWWELGLAELSTISVYDGHQGPLLCRVHWGHWLLWSRGLRVCVLGCLSHVRLSVTLWTVAHQVPLPTGFPRQEYWSGLPSRLQEIFPHPGVEPTSLMSPALVSGFFTTSATKSMPEERKECTPSLRTGGMNTLTPSEKRPKL